MEAHTVGLPLGDGIHAFKTRERVESELLGLQEVQCFVYGEVELWGRIYEFEEGYHAEFAQVKSLYHAAPETQALLRKNYGIAT